jgi:hypothetical protein
MGAVGVGVGVEVGRGITVEVATGAAVADGLGEGR